MTTEQQNPPLKILLADDDKDDRFFFEKALKEISIPTKIYTVNDGEQLMQYLTINSENLPDVLFLDLSMPRKNGFECLSEIKENKQLKDFPVIMFSTSFPRDKSYEQDMINMLYKIGAFDYISKPGDIEQLKTIIYKLLTKLIEKKSLDEQIRIS